MPIRDFDDDFRRTERTVNRTIGLTAVLAAAWIFFLMFAIGTGLFLLGRWTGVW